MYLKKKGKKKRDPEPAPVSTGGSVREEDVKGLLIGKYQIMEVLGKGGFGVVYRAFNSETGGSVAVKRTPVAGVKQEDLASIEMEVELLQNLDHPNIVKYIEAIPTEDYLHIVLEYVESGALCSFFKANWAPSEALVSHYTRQVLAGLEYLHQQGIIHRDIKAANILSTKDGVIKLADFGVATKLAGKQHSVVGTPYWMAPEVIEMKETQSSACDIWGVGCTVIELLTCKPPYFDLNAMAALYRIVQDDHPPLPPDISPALSSFLLLCFEKDATKRIDASRLLEHEWIAMHYKQRPPTLDLNAGPLPIPNKNDGPSSSTGLTVPASGPGNPGNISPRSAAALASTSAAVNKRSTRKVNTSIFRQLQVEVRNLSLSLGETVLGPSLRSLEEVVRMHVNETRYQLLTQGLLPLADMLNSTSPAVLEPALAVLACLIVPQKDDEEDVEYGLTIRVTEILLGVGAIPKLIGLVVNNRPVNAVGAPQRPRNPSLRPISEDENGGAGNSNNSDLNPSFLSIPAQLHLAKILRQLCEEMFLDRLVACGGMGALATFAKRSWVSKRQREVAWLGLDGILHVLSHYSNEAPSIHKEMLLQLAREQDLLQAVVDHVPLVVKDHLTSLSSSSLSTGTLKRRADHSYTHSYTQSGTQQQPPNPIPISNPSSNPSVNSSPNSNNASSNSNSGSPSNPSIGGGGGGGGEEKEKDRESSSSAPSSPSSAPGISSQFLDKLTELLQHFAIACAHAPASSTLHTTLRAQFGKKGLLSSLTHTLPYLPVGSQKRTLCLLAALLKTPIFNHFEPTDIFPEDTVVLIVPFLEARGSETQTHALECLAHLLALRPSWQDQLTQTQCIPAMLDHVRRARRGMNNNNNNNVNGNGGGVVANGTSVVPLSQSPGGKEKERSGSGIGGSGGEKGGKVEFMIQSPMNVEPSAAAKLRHELALSILFRLAHGGKEVRHQLQKCDVLPLFLDLLGDPVHAVAAMSCFPQWLLDDLRYVENLFLSSPKNAEYLIGIFQSSDVDLCSKIIEPIEKIAAFSARINKVLGSSERFVEALKERLFLTPSSSMSPIGVIGPESPPPGSLSNNLPSSSSATTFTTTSSSSSSPQSPPPLNKAKTSPNTTGNNNHNNNNNNNNNAYNALPDGFDVKSDLKPEKGQLGPVLTAIRIRVMKIIMLLVIQSDEPWVLIAEHRLLAVMDHVRRESQHSLVLVSSLAQIVYDKCAQLSEKKVRATTGGSMASEDGEGGGGGGQQMKKNAHWVPDSITDHCQRCKRMFGLVHRRHHCRLCGYVVCAKCSPKTLMVQRLDAEKPVRVCNPCHTSFSVNAPGATTTNATTRERAQ